MRRLLGAALLAVGVASASTAVAAAQAAAFPVDRQGDAYTFTAPATYTQTADHSYVGQLAGQEESHALVHVDLSGLDPAATVSQLVLSVKDDATDSAELQAASAALSVCRLDSDFANGRQQGTGPTVDCLKPVAGSLKSDGTWAFDLSGMASDWRTGANHGVAVVGQSSPGASWRLALKASLTRASGSVTPPAPAAQPQIGVAPVPAATAQPAALPPVIFAPLPAVIATAPIIEAPPVAAGPARPAPLISTGEKPASSVRLPLLWLVVAPAIAAVLAFAAPPGAQAAFVAAARSATRSRPSHSF